MILVTVTLSDWIYRSVVSRSVLTLHRDYFRLRKPLERRVYEIARKHCGRQAEWRIGLETLLKKSGSTSPRRVFRKMIRDIAEEDGLPDYRLELDRGRRGAGARARRGSATAAGEGPRLGAEIHARARAAAPGLRPATGSRPSGGGSGRRSGRPRLRSPEAAFLAFARARAARGWRGSVPRAERFRSAQGICRGGGKLLERAEVRSTRGVRRARGVPRAERWRRTRGLPGRAGSW